MVQVLPYVPNFADKLRESLSKAQDQYYAGKEKEKQQKAFAKLADPNATAAEKSQAIMTAGGTVQDLLKFHQQQQTQEAIKRFDTAQSRGSGSTQVTDQDVGGQANEQPIADIQGAPSIGSPTAPTQVIKAQKPNVEPQQINEEEVDSALRNLAAISPQTANPLINITGQRRKAQTEKEKLNLKKELSEKQERLAHHQSFEKFDSKLSEEGKAAENRLHAYDEVEAALKSGKTNPKKLSNFLANKYSGTQWEGIFSNSEREKIKAASLYMFDGMKELFGGQLSNQKLKVASGKVIDPTKTEKANQAIIDFRRFYDKAKVVERQIADEIKKENGGYRPIDFDIQLRNRVAEKLGAEADEALNLAITDGVTSQNFVTMRNKNDGKLYSVPVDQIDKYKLAGGVIQNG